MSRLIHSEAALIRSFQISGCNFFAFVEGGLDRPFYERLVIRVCGNSAIKYQITSSKELPGETGGKERLLKFFKELRKRNMLTSSKFGKKLVAVFFLDKDVDDLVKMKIRSKHVIYTDAYDLEGQLFSCGDLHRAVADACGMTTQQVSSLLGAQNTWVVTQVSNWIDWTVLCVLGQVTNTNRGCTFNRVSDINPNLIETVNLEKLITCKAALAKALSLSSTDFEILYSKYKKRVENSIQHQESLRFFKGKWLKSILEKYIATQNIVPDVSHNGAGDKVVSTLLAQVGHANCTCCSRVDPPLLDLLKLAT